MPTAPETGKRRASRIPLDYHRRLDLVGRLKLLATLAAVLFVAIYLGWGHLRGNASAARFSHGPVASVHARWENDCAACHIDFQPIRGDAFAASWGGWRTDQAAKCQTCHVAPAHQNSDALAAVGTCSDCHHEHQGYDSDLTRVADRACTICHGNLQEHLAEGSRYSDPIANVVTSFPEHHPEFRSLATDPGRLKFPHRQHLSPGQRKAPDDRSAKAISDLSEADQPRYRRADVEQSSAANSELVTLDCVSCHRTDDAGSLATENQLKSLWTTGSERRHMLPVTYNRDCKACHPLTVNPDTDQTIAHGLGPEEILETLRDILAHELIERDPAIAKHFDQRRPVPGRAEAPEAIAAREALAENVATAARHVQHLCQKCHYMKESTAGSLAAVEPVNIPIRWLKHARFDHRPHRAMNCKECHAQADSSDHSSDVMIAGRSTCLECHSPASSVTISRTITGGARHDCAECHNYHHRTGP